MGNPNKWIDSVADLELSLPRLDSKNNYLVHNTIFNCPKFIKDYKFDAIVLNSTFLDARHNIKRFNRIKASYNFIKSSDAVKVALAQDDYDCNEELDNWMLDWNIDFFYSVIHKYSSKLFPNYSKVNKIYKGYTGYINTEKIKNKLKQFELRKYDIGYRGIDIVTNLNELTLLKANIGKTFTNTFKKFNLKMNISSKYEDRFYGTDWLNFVEDCKFMIGTNSGSSLIFPNLKFKEKVESYIEKNQNISLENIRNKFFKTHAKKYYTAISPRNLETAIYGTCQINTTKGDYSGLLEPYNHFIPLNSDCSNYQEVYELINNKDLVKKIINDARDVILSTNDLRIENFVDKILSQIKSKIKNENNGVNFKKIVRKYKLIFKPIEMITWNKDFIKDKVKFLIGYKTKGLRIK